MIDVERYRHLTRQLELIPVDTLNKPVHIIGCGAIGSFLGLQKAYVSPSLGKQWETTASYTQPLLGSQNVPANTYEDVMEWGAYGYGLKVEAER